MSKAYTGGCACGAIRYELSAEPLVMNAYMQAEPMPRSSILHGAGA